jgi:hypothetical protein
MKKFFFVFLVFLILFGCLYNPNQNVKSVGCCNQAELDFYTCKKGNLVENTKDLYNLIDCGEYNGIACKYFNSTSEEILDANKQTIKKPNGLPINPNDCSKNCNFDQVNCTNQDDANTCYSLTNKKITYPICVNNSALDCINNNCKVFACGEKSMTAKKVIGSFEIDKLKSTYENAKSSVFLGEKEGLVGKVCELRYLNASTNRLLKNKNWLVNNLRLGILGSFSDYEVAKFYFPPSDNFCIENPDALVDRFTNYLTKDVVLTFNLNTKKVERIDDFGFIRKPPLDSNPKAPLNFCKQNATHYYCANQPDIAFPISYQFAKDLCFILCSKKYSDQENVYLNLLSLNVTPKTSLNIPSIIHYTLDFNSYYKYLNLLYPDDTSSDYYRKEGEKGLGPEGAKVFECISDSDCLSSKCIKNVYFRGKCFKKADNSSVSCSCNVFKSCKDAFDCSVYIDQSIEYEQCIANYIWCQNNYGDYGPVVMCNYNPTTYDLYTYSDLGQSYILNFYGKKDRISVWGNQSFDDVWGVYDFMEFNKYKKPNLEEQQIEFAVVMKKIKKYGCVDEKKKEINPPPCPSGFTFYEINKKCVNASGSQVDPLLCPDGSNPQEWTVWIDNSLDMYNSELLSNFKHDNLRWYWKEAFAMVPNLMTVSSSINPKRAVIITSRNVTFEDLKKKFPLIQACNMKSTSDISQFNSDEFDILEISFKNIPLKNHSDIEKYVSPIYYFSGWKVKQKDFYALFDKTWVIKSYGDCQIDNALNVLKTKSYGVCQSCGTILSLAYQKVDQLITTDGAVYSYCPAGCVVLDDDRYCVCNNKLIAINKPFFVVGKYITLSSTIPELSYLLSKIDYYQKNNIIPILDLTNYSYVLPASMISYEFRVQDLENAEYFCIAGTYTCDQSPSEETDPNGEIVLSYKCKCNFKSDDDLLLSSLNKNHNAIILIADYLPPAKSPIDSKSKIQNISNLCKDCLIALEYKDILIINDSTKTLDYYNQTLNQSIYIFSSNKLKLPSEDMIGYPPDQADLASISDLDIIVLNIDLSTSKKEDYQQSIKKAIDFSRYVLAQSGKPTIWKLRFKNSAGAYLDPVFFDTLFRNQIDLTLSGVIGILIPSLFDKDENILSNPYFIKFQPTFISVQNGSLSLTDIFIENDVTKINAINDTCLSTCLECPPTLKVFGACKSECLDGNICPEGYSCKENCISKSYCESNLCEANFASKKLTCYVLNSSSKGQIEKLTFNSFNSVYYHPDAEKIFASITPKCCLKETNSKQKNTYYSYYSSPSLSYNIESAIFPHFGSNDTNCGKISKRFEPNSQDVCLPENQMQDYTFSNKLYYCFFE